MTIKFFNDPERLWKLFTLMLDGAGVTLDVYKRQRAPYLLDAARRVADGRADLSAMAALPDDALLEQLNTIHGVGVKVASCVMLFG